MRGFLKYSDLISACFGIVAALILAVPLLGELRDRRHWDRMLRFMRRARVEEQHISKSREEIEIERRLRDQMIDARLGEFETYKRTTLWGFFFLLISFVVLGVAAFDRAFLH
jgi:hypothetical protein